MSVISKVLTAALYRIGQTDLALKMQGKIHEAVLQAQQIANQTIAEATSLADQTIEQAQDIADSFTIRRIGSQDNVEASVNYFAANPSATEGYIWVDSTCPFKEWDETAQKYKAKVYVNVLYIGGEEVTV